MDKKQEKFDCLECRIPFSRLSNLRKHVRKFHPSKLNELAPMHYKNAAKFRFTCQICSKNFNYEKHLRAHNRTHYNSTEKVNCSTINNSKKCPLCSFENSYEKKMLSHFEEVHDISIKLEEMLFLSWEEFVQWKSTLEINTRTKFVKRQIENFKTHASFTYICNRSGRHISKSKGLRCLKTQGSRKINAYCPAGIKVYKYKDGKCQVKFCDTHIGHEAELCHLLASRKKENLVSAEAPNADVDDIEEENIIMAEDSDILIEVISIESENVFEKEKEQLKMFLINKLDNIQSPTELEFLKKGLQPVFPTLATLDNYRSIPVLSWFQPEEKMCGRTHKEKSQ